MNDSTQITQDTTVTAQYNVNTYTVRINPNGASGSTKTYTVSYGQKWNVPSCPFSRTGYNFTGYSGGYSAGQSITITGNITINCNWSAKTYTVTIYPNGASGSNKTYSVAHGASWTIPSCPFTRSGYNFQNYRLNSTSGAAYSAGAKLTINSNTKLYCIWVAKPKQSVTVHYKTGQGTARDVSTTIAPGSQKNFGKYYTAHSDGATTEYYPCDSSGKSVNTLTISNVNGSVSTYTVSYKIEYDYTPDKNSGTITL